MSKNIVDENTPVNVRCTTGKYEFPADPILSNNKFVVGNIGNVKPSFG
jgi:hypothetical protein